MARPHNGCYPPTTKRRRIHREPHIEPHGQSQNWYRLMLQDWNSVGLTPLARTVMGLLVASSSPALDRDVILSLPQIATRVSSSLDAASNPLTLAWGEGPDAIATAIRELVAKGWVEIEDRQLEAHGARAGGAQINCYRILLPHHMTRRWDTVKANTRAKGGRTSKPTRPPTPEPAPKPATKPGRNNKPVWLADQDTANTAFQAAVAAPTTAPDTGPPLTTADTLDTIERIRRDTQRTRDGP